MLEPHQRATLIPNEPGAVWHHFLSGRFIGPISSNTSLAITMQNIEQQSPFTAILRGLVELSSGSSLPVVSEFIGELNLETREIAIHQSQPERHFSGQFSENGRAILVNWLADDAFTKKAPIIEEMVRLNDKSLVPEIRKFVYAKDDYVSVSARSALLRLGEADAKTLLLEMVRRSTNPTARHNAMHTLNWDYTGDFSSEEKIAIRALRQDQDEKVARVAGFIAEKWRPKK